MDRAAVLVEMGPVLDLKAKRVEHNTRTRVAVSTEGMELRHGGKDYRFGEGGVGDLLKFTGLPAGLARGLRPRTMEAVLTELLSGKGTYNLVLKEDEVTSIARPYTGIMVDPEKAFKQVERSVPEVDYHRVLTANGKAVVELVGPKRAPVRLGDDIQAGLSLKFSPIGTNMPEIDAFTMRLMCTNGAIMRSGGESFRFAGGEGDDVWHWFRQTSKEAYGGFQAAIDEYKVLAERVIPPAERPAMVEGALKAAGVKSTDAATVRAWALESPPETEWDIFNLITRAASHLIFNPDSILRAQGSAANFASEAEHRRVCPSCNRSR